MNKSWALVFGAGLLEVVWVMGLTHSTTWWMWLGTVVMLIISFVAMIQALKTLPVSTVYAVFTGLGTVGTVIVEMIFFDEPFRWAKVLLILTLLIGVLGLKMVTGTSNQEGSRV